MSHPDTASETAAERNVELACATLKQRFGERLQTGQSIREQHGHTLSWLPNQPPDAVIFANDANDVISYLACHILPDSYVLCQCTRNGVTSGYIEILRALNDSFQDHYRNLMNFKRALLKVKYCF